MAAANGPAASSRRRQNASIPATVGANPPAGVVTYYWLKTKPKEVTLEYIDASGKVIRKFTGKPPVEGQPTPPPTPGVDPNLPTDIGLNRFTWNFRLPNATTLPGLIMWGGSLAGPRVVPGNFQVRLSVDGKMIATESFSVKADPRLRTTQEDFQKQFDFLSNTHSKLSATHAAMISLSIDARAPTSTACDGSSRIMTRGSRRSHFASITFC